MSRTDKPLSKELIARLPRYNRYFYEYFCSGAERVSSETIARKLGITPSQVRNDLARFTAAGRQGYGYNVKNLYMSISEELGFHSVKNCILLGTGNVGRSLIGNKMFVNQGFRLLAAFDVRNVGQVFNGLTVRHTDTLRDFAAAERVDIAIIATPAENAQDAAQKAYDAGVRGFLNFSYIDLNLPPDAVTENVHLIDSLMRLSYKMSLNKELGAHPY
ncbi:redox-sensing transcriptional repressor Rex [Clostridia bacterium]|nr:redox-sensing transcriptional repressor Rex [Clostridia bacterium]